MKINLALLFFSFVLVQLSAQSELEFNQAKFLEFDGATGVDNYNATITVPAGKIWKIESASVNAIDNNGFLNTSSSYGYITLNGTVITNIETGSLTFAQHPAYPIWLPSGTYNLMIVQVACSVCNTQAFISALEFNVTN